MAERPSGQDKLAAAEEATAKVRAAVYHNTLSKVIGVAAILVSLAAVAGRYYATFQEFDIKAVEDEARARLAARSTEFQNRAVAIAKAKKPELEQLARNVWDDKRVKRTFEDLIAEKKEKLTQTAKGIMKPRLGRSNVPAGKYRSRRRPSRYFRVMPRSFHSIGSVASHSTR